MDGEIKEVASSDVSIGSRPAEGQSVTAASNLNAATIKHQPQVNGPNMPGKNDGKVAATKTLVARAKAIIEATKSDPYTRAIELNKLRAEYAEGHSSMFV